MSPTRPTYLYVTETLLDCSSLPDVPPDKRQLILDWMHAHGLDENQVIAGEPIARDPERRELRWTAWDGAGLVRQTTWAKPGDDPEVWPAPFPEELFETVAPSVCPHCHRPWTDTTPIVLPLEDER